ncbi:hypothetical protein KRR55_14875 [Paeniglutamicibacter sp. ABSL32-1]|uniref:hypothetical protein n=1 Tax=Paeniglutamicibacter quisquiliarum TaxID=2849498 RepID=UPI001C2DE5C3|nr:hypothetical protein [Paeniglutamicibacter quisquiliarum]MBV1780399.1 hypothetical protein [Paeniglutamicibacter quisquiliarum]
MSTHGDPPTPPRDAAGTPGGWGQPPPGWNQPPAGGTRGPEPRPGPSGWWQAPKPGVVELRPLGFADLLDATFAVVRRAPLATVANAMLVQLLPVLAMVLLVQWLDFSVVALERALDALASDPGSDPLGPGVWAEAFPHPWLAYAGAGVAVLVVQLLANVLVVGPATVAAMRAVLGLPTGWGQSLALARGGMLRIALWNVLLGAAGTALVAVPVAVSLLLAGALGVAVASLGMVAMFLVLAPLWLWVAIRICLVPALLITRPPGIARAVRSSWSLTQGSWWRTLGILLVVAVVLGIIGGILSQLAAVLGGQLFGAASAPDAVVALGIVVNALVGAAGMVLTQLMLTMLQVDLRIRRERLDLVLAAGTQHPGNLPIPGYGAPGAIPAAGPPAA